ncbi:mechanosensory protein 2 [Caerostris extrusa]|uniref:Mechanosensory protein 2 n=1 Tax=Caerostris extrusa TaxID=172846 RepID=A0AAV4QEW8_CAEEX|nr:mechanosensory protein 2 [Caerostris extrusa]
MIRIVHNDGKKVRIVCSDENIVEDSKYSSLAHLTLEKRQDPVQGQRDGGCGRGGVLPHQQRHHCRVQRGGLWPLDTPAGRHHAAQRPRHKEPLGDTLGRESISHVMQSSLDEATDPWGVKVERVEIKDVRLPVQLQRAMAAEAEAAREARAKVIAAEGEQRASRALKEAAEVIADSPSALQLRYLQTLNSIAAEKNSTIVFPLPMELFRGMQKVG